MADIMNWDKTKILKFSIDNTLIDEELTDFPVLLNISETAGINRFDCSPLFNNLMDATGKDDTSNYSLILNFENGFVDLSEQELLISSGGTPGLTSGISKFGNKALSLNGASWLIVNMTDALVPGTGDFTIHSWYYVSAITTYIPFFYLGFYTLGIFLYYNGGKLTCIVNGTIINDTTVALPLSSWFHIALVISSSMIMIFLNGVQQGTAYGPYMSGIVPTNPLLIGKDEGYANSYFTGYIDEFIIVKGEALWTTNFTPPSTGINPAKLEIKKIAAIYPSVQEHWVDGVLKNYIHGSTDELFCEIESYSSTNKSIQLWVKVPKVLVDQPTDILLYYDITQEDNNDYVGFTKEYPATQVWTNNYAAVYHMAQIPQAGLTSTLDSTSNANHGVPYSLLTTDRVAGLIGYAINFDGANDHINVPNHTSLMLTGSLTMEAFAKVLDNGTARGLMLKGVISSWGDYHLSRSGVDDKSMFVLNKSSSSDNGTGRITGGPIYKDEWFSLSAVYDKSSQYLFTDGIVTASGTFTSDVTTDTNSLFLGRSYNAYFYGPIQSLILSNTARSAAWIKAGSYMQRDALINIDLGKRYKISGHVAAFGSPVRRTIFLYDRVSGVLLDKIISDDAGYYTLYANTGDRYNVVCLDDDTGMDLSDILISKIVPVEVV